MCGICKLFEWLYNLIMKLHIIMHESFEAPGAIELWAEKNTFEVTYTKLYQGDNFPADVSFDFLVIMGGPQSPNTTTEECPHFNAAEEIAFIKKVINADKLVLGVCLGAQLIGEALEASFEHSPNREIGMFEVSLTEEGKQDTIFSKFPEKFMVGHWHGDMPGVTSESKILAVSRGCPRQIVKYSQKVYGFQCHFEFTSATIEGMIQNSTVELEQYKGLQYIESPDVLRNHIYSDINKLLYMFLDEFVKNRN